MSKESLIVILALRVVTLHLVTLCVPAYIIISLVLLVYNQDPSGKKVLLTLALQN